MNAQGTSAKGALVSTCAFGLTTPSAESGAAYPLDALTGLVGKPAILNAINRLNHHDSGSSQNTWAMLVAFDLDHFKMVNDCRGHQTGDALLAWYGRQLRQLETRCICNLEQAVSVLPARAGGDEFLILIAGEAEKPTPTKVAELCYKHLTESQTIRGISLSETISLGLTELEANCCSEELLQRADAALYDVKARGRNGWYVYSNELHARYVENRQLQKDLLSEFDHESIEIWFQPQISLSDSTLHGYEALMRWRHPRLGLLEADRFLDAAVCTSKIVEIDQWVVEKSMALFRQYLGKRATQLNLGINISGVWLLHCDVKRLLDLCENYEIAPAQISLEISEAVLADTRHDYREILFTLSNAGFNLAMDKFGFGASSLKHLVDVPIHSVKIDQELVGNSPKHRPLAAILQATITAAHNLGLKVYINELEKPCEIAQVQAMDADFGQGYAIASPAPASSLQANQNTSPFEPHEVANTLQADSALAALRGDAA